MTVPGQPLRAASARERSSQRFRAASARERSAPIVPGTSRSLALAALTSSTARLAVGVALLAATWLLVLPAISRQTPLRRVIDRNQAHGVNANAMYYTELEGVRFLDLWRSPSGR